MNKINYVKGDVVKSLKDGDIDFLVHCCNAQGIMGSGVAKQIKQQYPEAFDAYLENHELGAATIADGVINVVGQEFYGKQGKRYVHYGALSHGLSKIKLLAYDVSGLFYKRTTHLSKGKARIGIPFKFASDRAGGDWEVVSELIEGLLCPYFDVYVYELEASND